METETTKPRPLAPPRWLLLSAAVTLSSLSPGHSFQIGHSFRSARRRTPSPPSARSSRVDASSSSSSSSSSFQRARLAEQLRLSTRQAPNGDGSVDPAPLEASPVADGGANGIAGDVSEEAWNILEKEKDALGPDGMPFAPMMTYQKYLTMQEKRVKVTVRYSAEAGLRPFYLTVASQIKSTHPDVLLEKRILPPVGFDAGGDEAVFEVVVDGKTVTGKKKTKMLKVSSLSPRKTGGDDDDGKGEDGKGEGGKSKSGGGDENAPDIAGGRSVFVSMEKLDHELTKARKRRRPNTLYKSKEDALRGAVATGTGGTTTAGGSEGEEGGGAARSTGTTEAVIRLERLKAMSTRNKI
ncbi:hypothetical protein ACHAWF_004140 [Thalassiosira exigua]